MQSYIDPKIQLITDPEGIDYQIQRVQVYLANLSWIDKIFGRATIQRRQIKEVGRKTYSEQTFPEVWGQNNEPENVMPNDNLNAYVFFIAHDPNDYPDYEALQSQISMQKRVSVILWCNLEKLDNTKKYRYSENIKRQFLEILAHCPGFILERDYEQYDQVLKEFTLGETYNKYLKPPYYGLRVDGTMYYKMFSENVCSSVNEVFPLPDFTQEKINTLLNRYAPNRLDFIIGTDIEAGTELEPNVHILRANGFGDADNPLALSEVEVLHVIWQNTPVQGFTINESNETINFGLVLPGGTITILFREKLD